MNHRHTGGTSRPLPEEIDAIEARLKAYYATAFGAGENWLLADAMRLLRYIRASLPASPGLTEWESQYVAQAKDRDKYQTDLLAALDRTNLLTIIERLTASPPTSPEKEKRHGK